MGHGARPISAVDRCVTWCLPQQRATERAVRPAWAVAACHTRAECNISHDRSLSTALSTVSLMLCVVPAASLRFTLFNVMFRSLSMLPACCACFDDQADLRHESFVTVSTRTMLQAARRAAAQSQQYARRAGMRLYGAVAAEVPPEPASPAELDDFRETIRGFAAAELAPRAAEIDRVPY